MTLTAQSTQDEKNAHYRAALQAYADNVSSDNLEGILNLFADDAEVEDPLGGERGVLTGEGIRRFYESVVERKVRMKVMRPISGSKGNGAAMSIHISVLGAEMDVISVARFNEAGKIVRYTAHWGPGDYNSSDDPSHRKAG